MQQSKEKVKVGNVEWEKSAAFAFGRDAGGYGKRSGKGTNRLCS